MPNPNFEPAECRFEIPRNRDVECGFLTVPEDRGAPDSREIRLHVAVFKSDAPDKAPDPVVYLSGGPGSSALREAELVFNRLFAPFLERRDVVIFDQRGTGTSEPALDCPEFVEMAYDSLGDRLGVEEEVALIADSLLACRDRLTSEGVDLRAYNSAENAADLADLRRALGYDSWNLLGISYGTRLALTAMRDSPDGIRSVILDSTYPPQVDAYASFLPDADRAFTTFFRGCATDPSCDARYPHLETAFYRLVEDLDRAPVVLSITHPLTDKTIDWLLTGDRLIGFLFQSLYSTELIPLLPLIVSRASEGKFNALAAVQGSFLIILDLISVGMHHSVQCGEEVPFSSRIKVEADAEAYPRLRGLLDRQAIFPICQIWSAEEANPMENEPVRSVIPALVLAGEYDPITPPEWGRLAAESLENSVFFEFPGTGHGVTGTGECALGIMLAFLDAPASQPDGDCKAGIGGPEFSGKLGVADRAANRQTEA